MLRRRERGGAVWLLRALSLGLSGVSGALRTQVTGVRATRRGWRTTPTAALTRMHELGSERKCGVRAMMVQTRVPALLRSIDNVLYTM